MLTSPLVVSSLAGRHSVRQLPTIVARRMASTQDDVTPERNTAKLNLNNLISSLMRVKDAGKDVLYVIEQVGEKLPGKYRATVSVPEQLRELVRGLEGQPLSFTNEVQDSKLAAQMSAASKALETLESLPLYFPPRRLLQRELRGKWAYKGEIVTEIRESTAPFVARIKMTRWHGEKGERSIVGPERPSQKEAVMAAAEEAVSVLEAEQA